MEEKNQNQPEFKPVSEWEELVPKEMAEKPEPEEKRIIRPEEKGEAPEEGLEEKEKKAEEKISEILKKEIVKEKKATALTTGAHPVIIPEPSLPKSETQRKIEDILMENLEDIFSNLSETQRQEFRVRQEETASKIEKLIQSVKIKIKEILTLIKEFLKVIPGVNKFFLEQEVKIKTDKILGLKK